MIEDLKLRNYSPSTIEGFVRAIPQFAEFHNRPPQEMGAEEVRKYLLYLVKSRWIKPSALTKLHT